MGMPKGLLEIQGEPWLVQQLRALNQIGMQHAVVVLGEESHRYNERLPWTTPAAAPGNDRLIEFGRLTAQVVLNPTPELGPFSSLVVGLRCLFAKRNRSPVYVLPIDVPCPGSEVWLSLTTLLSNGLMASMPTYEGRGGHPVLLSAPLIEKLSQIAPDIPEARLDVQLRSLPKNAVARVNTDDRRVRMNLNTPEDWRAYTQFYPSFSFAFIISLVVISIALPI
jgi:CTP:molybdopterin cytidylyltransferase MocA